MIHAVVLAALLALVGCAVPNQPGTQDGLTIHPAGGSDGGGGGGMGR